MTLLAPILDISILITDPIIRVGELERLLILETPDGLLVDSDYAREKIKYWQYYLYEAAGVDAVHIEDEDHWPYLYKVLIAKLVIYDFILRNVKGSITATSEAASSSVSSSSSGALKSLEIGPSKAEWYDSSQTVKNLFSPNSQGVTSFDLMALDTCALANKLGVYLSMCQRGTHPIVPKLIKRHIDPDAVTILNKNYGEWAD